MFSLYGTIRTTSSSLRNSQTKNLKDFLMLSQKEWGYLREKDTTMHVCNKRSLLYSKSWNLKKKIMNMPEDQRKNSNNSIFKSNLPLSKTYLASWIGQQKLWIKLQVLNLCALALQHSFSSFLPETRQLDFFIIFIFLNKEPWQCPELTTLFFSLFL